jgi:HK97 family phage prohead protease
MEKKTFELEFKELTEEGKFSGHLATFGNVDNGGDVVDPGAFKKTLRENKAFAFLWSHQGMPDTVAGSFQGKEDETGLAIDGGFYLDLEGSLKAYKTAKRLKNDGVKIGLSMGYRTIQYSYETVDGITIRHLKEVKLKEGSITLWPMNEQAQLETIKEESETDLETKPSKENHVCTIGSGDYARYRSETREHDGKPYTIRFGIKKDGKAEEYEYFYPVKNWAAAAAKAHCKDHKGSFEAATGKAINFVCKSCGETLTLTQPADATVPGAEPLKSEPSELHSVLQKIADNFKSQ